MGKVFLVGAGPGAADLLTLRAVRILHSADVVLYDALVSQEVLDLVNPAARRIHVGKRCGRQTLTQQDINTLMVYSAAMAGTVVRLKGGDPLIFGRGGEEIDMLRATGIPFEIVPGITCALAAAATAGFSLTDRRFASELTLMTGHHSDGNECAAEREPTIVVYMPGEDYGKVATSLLEAGLGLDTPCVIISRISLPDEQLCRTTVADLQSQSPLPAPALLIAGRVAQKAGIRPRVVFQDVKLQAMADAVVPSHHMPGSEW